MPKATEQQYADLEASIQNALSMAMLAAFTGNKSSAKHYSQRVQEYMRQRRELRAADAAIEAEELANPTPLKVVVAPNGYVYTIEETEGSAD